MYFYRNYFGQLKQLLGPLIRTCKLIGTQKWRKWHTPTGMHQMIKSNLENIKVRFLNIKVNIGMHQYYFLHLLSLSYIYQLPCYSTNCCNLLSNYLLNNFNCYFIYVSILIPGICKHRSKMSVISMTVLYFQAHISIK